MNRSCEEGDPFLSPSSFKGIAIMDRKELGRYAEAMAVKYLRRKGLKIIEQNFSCKLGELDIIARNGTEIVFIEVRSASTPLFHDPAMSITHSKIRRIRYLACIWLNNHKQQETRLRFDVVLVVLNKKEKEIRHIVAAF